MTRTRDYALFPAIRGAAFPAIRGAAAAALIMPLAAVPSAAAPVAAHSVPAALRTAAAARVPSLSIAVSDGRKTARPGDILSYRVAVTDSGSSGAPGLTLAQSMPPGFAVLSASRGGTVRAGKVRWRFGLRPGSTARFRVSGRIGPVPSRLLRLATIACVTAGRTDRPVICASHFDALPTAAAAGGRGRLSAAFPSGPSPPYVPAALGAATLAGLAGLAMLGRRRLSRTRR